MVQADIIKRGGYTAPLVETLVTIATDADLTPAIDIRGASFGGLLIPATVNGTSLVFHVSDATDGTFYQLFDADNAAVALTITSATAAAQALPAELFAFNAFKIETVTDQADTNTQFVVTLKG
jgi:hypothetical protein